MLKAEKYFHVQKEAFLINQIPEMVTKTELLHRDLVYPYEIRNPK